MFIKRRKLQLKMKLISGTTCVSNWRTPKICCRCSFLPPVFWLCIVVCGGSRKLFESKIYKLHCSKLNDYISIKVSEVRFWCAADILIFGIEKLLCRSFNLRIRKVLWKEALKKVRLYSPARPPPHYNGLHSRSTDIHSSSARLLCLLKDENCN